eukprot:CAMPEP_0197026674 /NCGR_PEP_ID=MMETSP1384-20130603/6711_1 /TAXON_ID=29189 /ORGANISM="Ammonia sp." /LENGTH=437 /DNA_ID=CAMNT_0042455379 /DNA_START=30 /DNA_END=1343 /DNA_ORIENTATION=-
MMIMICHGPTKLTTVVIDIVMMLIATACLLLVVYGIYKYVELWRATKEDYLRPPVYIHRSGLFFFVISLITLFNALLYDIFYLVCKELDEYEGPIYHTVYFLQIYSLWIILFLRVYYLFTNSMFRLSRTVVYAYCACFIAVALSVIPVFVLFRLEAESYLTLPYVALSICFSTALLVTFLMKLLHIFLGVGADELLINTATKNTLLAFISICCTFVVIFVLIGLYIRHQGDWAHHSVLEELMLEFAILVDIVSNFVCVLLTYKFFDKQYYRLCGPLDAKFTNAFKKYLKRRIVRTRSRSMNAGHDDEKTMTEIVNSVNEEQLSTLTLTITTATKTTTTCTKSASSDGHGITMILHGEENHDQHDEPNNLKTPSLNNQYHSLPAPATTSSRHSQPATTLASELALQRTHSNPVRAKTRESLLMNCDMLQSAVEQEEVP